MRTILFLAFIFLFALPNLTAQDLTEFKKEQYILANDTLHYRILFPKDFDSNKKYPLVLFLHGSGERGNDNEMQLTHGAELFLNNEIRKTHPAFVVFPQCKTGQSWNNANVSSAYGQTIFSFPSEIEPNSQLDLVEGLLTTLRDKFKIDEKRTYIGGLSMGGMGTFEMLHRNPNTFAAAFPICGGANPRIAPKIKQTPIWIFHGESDDIVPSVYSTRMEKALQYAGADVKISLYTNVKHDSWTNAFAEPELLPWLFSKSKEE